MHMHFAADSRLPLQFNFGTALVKDVVFAVQLWSRAVPAQLFLSTANKLDNIQFSVLSSLTSSELFIIMP